MAVKLLPNKTVWGFTMHSSLPTEDAVRTHQAIARLNLSWLLLCREVAAHSVAEAALRFGVSPEVAQALREIPAERLAELADNDQMTFRPNIDVERLNRCREDAPQLATHTARRQA